MLFIEELQKWDDTALVLLAMISWSGQRFQEVVSKTKIAKMHRFPQWGHSCWYQHSLLFLQFQVLLKLRFVDKVVILWQNHSPHLVSGKSWNDAGAAIEADEQMYLFADFPMHHRRWMLGFRGVSQTKDHMFCHWSFLKSQYPQQVGWRDSAWPLFAAANFKGLVASRHHGYDRISWVNLNS